MTFSRRVITCGHLTTKKYTTTRHSAKEMIRYFDHHAVDTLKDGELKVSVPTRLNDPFEFLLNHEGFDYMDDMIRKAADRNIRILSFCNPAELKNQGDVLMWSHYVNSHRGFRIHFDEEILKELSFESMEIEYLPTIPEWKSFALPENEENALEEFKCIQAALSAKADIWNYEKEIRHFHTLDQCVYKKKTGFHYLRFPPEAVLRVDIGLNTGHKLALDVERILEQRKYSHVDLKEAYRAKGSYSLKYR